ncbi:phosphatase PAP2 family protein [Pseudoduganella ginsengisoli]|uniref:Phosphatase PAP2 family protein n=1 Tax=Pseudoduganella ginsengisoli TaxID=1462440 RepID=A0A6L6Q9A9_9BURK|nr:phosphatase PAP2 family protein [Pseudoduganella ginsengisoli]MTW06016.1 phosphatase PAP2 family protein [Pseudoduganella ginsengisoli]
MTTRAHSRVLRFIEARLAPDTEFGLHLTAGVLIIAIAAVLFAGLAGDVVRLSGLAAFDAQVSHWLHGYASSPDWRALTVLMLVLTHAHSVAGMVVLTGALAWLLWRRRERYWLLALLLSVPGGMLLNVLVKHLFQRARPAFDDPLVNLATYSFPSGHTSSATLLYGLLASYLVMQARQRHTRVVAVLACAAMVLLVGASRMYLGAHYPTDIAGAMLEGAGWLAVCITGVSTWRRRREGRAL